ncbi:uncharacterized protein PHACADRAFT_255284 [Phanerochaete carnosa HHB-10118-sp]|uniref:Uncharacterized protein n=1 Tax=Phanerochaete carnosa (strain HHB-10118-sp) TaxID=650164 RepID=K5VU16_PHACS|nr:uncharacterized protein PHACADRAFT_255284 [Phanerochaete carnosa HHB-10118-sp]EKM54998.1 hypothetical protein PHACADRAFT_255284 [Phanerochaete carnosa HHB-10118-sp]
MTALLLGYPQLLRAAQPFTAIFLFSMEDAVSHRLQAAVIGEFIMSYNLDIDKLGSHQAMEDPLNPPPTAIHLHPMSCISGYAMFLHLHTSAVVLSSFHASTGCALRSNAPSKSPAQAQPQAPAATWGIL